MRPRLSFLVCGLTLVACHRGGIAPLTPVLSDARVYYDDSPAIRDSVRQIVRDAAAWQTLWRRATALQSSPPVLPVIDFNRDMVVLVGAGRKSPGDQIHVDSAGVQNDFFVVWVRTVVQCRRFAGEVYPHELVRVAENDKPARFIETSERAGNCT